MQKYAFSSRNRKKNHFLYFFLMKLIGICRIILIFANWKLQTGNIMANRKSLKHSITLFCEELFAEAIAASLYGNDKQEENIEALLFSIIRLQADYISRISHVEPGMKPAVYFKKLREDFTRDASEIIDQINNL